jgi:hypothetical protein
MSPPMPAMQPTTHIDMAKHETEGEPGEEHMAALVSAPVGRPDYGAALGDPDLREGQVRLTAAEREIANLPGGPGETEYAKQKLRLMKQKKAGFHRD